MQGWFNTLMQLQGYPVKAAGEMLASLHNMGDEEFVDWQQNAAWAIARYHYQHNNFYKHKVGNYFPKRWEDLPIVTKSDLQQPLNKIICSNISLKDCYIASTSGSSGTPFFFAKDKYAHAMTWAIILDRYKEYSITPASLQARFYGIPKELASYYKEKIKDVLMNRVRFDVFDLSDTTLSLYTDKFRKNRFEYLYGYTNSLTLFARYLIKKSVVLKDICPSLKLCISTSELSTPEDDILFKQAFGIPHIREYGISETCLTGFNMPAGNFQLTEETLLNEVVDGNNKVVSAKLSGKLLSTSLFNKALPMIRYETGDEIILSERKGKYRTIEQLIGRTNDTIKLPSGKVAAGLTFYYISRSILENTDSLKEFIIRQSAIDHFVFDIVSSRELTTTEIDTIKAKMSLYLEPGLILTINRVDKIERSASGKLKHFYSELS